ncbi:MAG: uroporphyrinogen III methylase [Gammaproteobacteria bacterium]|nr:uroporphyrinogen III methylase [Gammaproteobacteria bacterium]
MVPHSLIIVGSGIKFMSHLTVEAKAYIQQSDKVLYLVNEPVMQEWIMLHSSNPESLDELYTKNLLRNDNYQLIAEYILEKLRVTKVLCVVMYGHPTAFAQPALSAARKASDQGYKVMILPGISAEACLFADLMIDPGTYGCQSFEATDFLLYGREYDTSSHLILWQSYVIGVLGLPKDHNPQKGLQLLAGYLQKKYDSNHEIVLYEAAQYPAFSPRIDKVTLQDLPHATISSLTTLYIKPAKQKSLDANVLEMLRTSLIS